MWNGSRLQYTHSVSLTLRPFSLVNSNDNDTWMGSVFGSGCWKQTVDPFFPRFDGHLSSVRFVFPGYFLTRLHTDVLRALCKRASDIPEKAVCIILDAPPDRSLSEIRDDLSQYLIRVSLDQVQQWIETTRGVEAVVQKKYKVTARVDTSSMPPPPPRPSSV
jgi:hypothetical protein